MIAGYLFFVFSAILCSARDGNIETSRGLSKPSLREVSGLHLGLIYFSFLHTQVHRLSLSVTDSNSAAQSRENTENSLLDNILKSINTASAILLEEVYSVIE